MAALADFEISRISPDQVRTAEDAGKLVDVFHAATKDDIYQRFRSHLAACFKDIVDLNSGVFQVARLKNDLGDQILGVALVKLRFGGSRDPKWKFVATARQTALYSDIFATGLEETRPIRREFTGDPVLTRFTECLEAEGQTLAEIDEDILIIEPVYILPQYQHIEGLARALLAPVLERAIAKNLKVIAYNHRYRHDYSHPTVLSADFRLLYPETRVVVHVDTRETPQWTGVEVIWDYEFQWFTLERRPTVKDHVLVRMKRLLVRGP